MSDEFDDEHASWHAPLHESGATESQRLRVATPRLVSRLYRQAKQPLRTQMLDCLLRPLNALSLMGVSAGAFAHFLDHKPAVDSALDLDASSRFSPSQIAELTDFVEQVNPDAVQQMATMLADHALEIAAFSATAAVFMRRGSAGAPTNKALRQSSDASH